MLSDYLYSLPEDTIISIGSENSSGWFYFGRASQSIKDITLMDEYVKKKYQKKIQHNKYRINDLKNFLSNPARYNRMIKKTKKDKKGQKETFMDFFIKSDVYIKYWKELNMLEKSAPILKERYDNFMSIDDMEYEYFNKAIAEGQIGILIKDLYVSGNYWNLDEWENKYGKI